jgi:nucleoside-diphosphate-sugar epimerase
MDTPTILVTGATGFIGGAACTQLLLCHPTSQILLLVRGETEEAAEFRVRQSLARFAPPSALEAAWSRCRIVLGNLTDLRALANPLLDEATHVLHLAANTSFRSVRSVRHTNLLGTLTLAHRMRPAPRLRRFLYVSTAYICGPRPPPVVHEGDYPRPDVRHFIEYTASKAECEMLLENTAPELPLVVARPSVVVGHTRLGCGPSASIFWYYRTLDLLRRTTFPLDTRKDIVPVDYAAEALLFLLLEPTLGHRRYHISAGEAASVTWHEIAAEFARIHGERPGIPYRQVDFPTLVSERGRLAELLGPGDEDLLLTALEAYCRFSSSGVQVFDNRRLLEEGMAPPPRFTSYLRTCALAPPGRSIYEQMLDDE